MHGLGEGLGLEAGHDDELAAGVERRERRHVHPVHVEQGKHAHRHALERVCKNEVLCKH